MGPLTRPGDTQGASPITPQQTGGGGGGSGDVVGPASSVQYALAYYNSATGKLLGYLAVAPLLDASGNLTFGLATECRFRDPNCSILSPASGSLRIRATVEHLFQSAGFFFLDYAASRYVFTVVDVAGAVNYLRIKNSATGTALRIEAAGSDPNVGFNIVPLGTGHLQENGTAVMLITTVLVAAQFPALTGDVTTPGASLATTIANAAVTLAKMANLAQDQFIGRVTASTGVPETATITAAARTVLDDTTVAAMLTTLGGIGGSVGAVNNVIPVADGTGTKTLKTPTPGDVTVTNKFGSYNGITTVANGVPADYAVVDLTAQGAAIAATTAYAVPAAGQGMYRVSWVATVTQAATTSCVLGGTTGFQVKFTDPDDSVVKTSNPTTVTASAINATGTTISGVCICRCKLSTNLQYIFGYTSVGVTPMQYNLHIVVEAI